MAVGETKGAGSTVVIVQRTRYWVSPAIPRHVRACVRYGGARREIRFAAQHIPFRTNRNKPAFLIS